jgi:hypothetical protein
MKRFLFYSKITFICNILFCYCLFIRATKIGEVSNDVLFSFSSVIVILGWFVAPILTVFENIYLFWLFIKKKDSGLASWRIVATVLFLMIQIFVHFIMPA